MPSPDRSADRLALVALNASPLSRATICALGRTADEWLGRRPSAALARRLGLSVAALERGMSAARRSEVASREVQRARLLGCSILTLLDEDYPAALRQLPLPPPVLCVVGRLGDSPGVGIVGSRRATSYGKEAARFFARHVAAAGVTIVSGLAYGVDGAAHQGALEADQGHTVAVLGCGVDVPYPRGHTRLREQIRARGALVSELPLGTSPRPGHFPIRNRLIAALGAATLVVEAAPRSGSLITARHALELGRDIFAVPGGIFDAGSLGTNALLRAGARIALHPQDILDELGIEPSPERAVAAVPAPPSGPHAALLALLRPGGAESPERLAAELGAPVDEVLSGLLELELEGRVVRHPGGSYGARA